MTVEVQEIDDIPDHRGRFGSLLDGTVDHKVSSESSRLFDVGEGRVEVGAFCWMREGCCSGGSAGTILGPLVQIMPSVLSARFSLANNSSWSELT